MTRTVILGGREIRYEFQRKKVKNVNLRIRADGSVAVSASRSVPEEKIEEFLLEKAGFILRTLDRFEEERKKMPLPARYEEGERFPLFGQDLTLHLLKGTKNRAAQNGTVLVLTVTNPDDFELKKRTLESYADRRCKETITDICETVYPLFAARGVLYPELRFRRMTSRWGSCRPKAGILTFNKRLAACPIPCIEYVVMHEFTHFLQPDHSARFWETLASFMPDWKARKQALDRGLPFPESTAPATNI